MNRVKLVLLPLLLLFVSVAGFAQDIYLVGDTGWAPYTRRLLEIYAREIHDDRPEGTSGFLYLRARATAAPSGGDFSQSYLFGSLRLGSMRAGTVLTNIDYLTHFAPPPAGLYYTAMTVEEAGTGGYTIIDYVDLPGVVNFGGFGLGTAQGRGSNGDVNFTGDVSWQSANGRVVITADQIINERATPSRALRLRLWATAAPYDGGDLQGQVLAVRSLRRLRPGFAYNDLAVGARFRPPAPEGTYYTVMTLEEFVRFRWVVVDYVAFPDPSVF